MIREKLPALTLVLVLLLSAVAGGAGIAVASQNDEFNGTSADTADQTGTTYLDAGTDTSNFSVAMTENQSISAGGSVTFDVAYTPEDATIASSSGSGTLSATVNSDTVVVSETGGSSSATLEELQIEFDVVDSTDKSGVPAIDDEVMNASAELVSDNDNSEIHDYYIYDAEDILDVTYEFTNGNYSTVDGNSAYDPESLENTTEMTVNVTRNGTVHEQVPLEYANLTLEFNEDHLKNLEDVTNTSGVTRTDKVAAGDFVKYVYDIDSPDATSESDAYDLDFEFTPTSETGEDVIVVTENVDPAGGLAADHVTEIDFGESSSGLAFYDVANVPFWAIALGGVLLVIALGALVYYRSDSMGFSNLFGVAPTEGAIGIASVVLLFVPGILMIVDTMAGTNPLPVIGMEFNVFTDLVTGLGLPSVAPLAIGALLVSGYIYLNRAMFLS